MCLVLVWFVLIWAFYMVLWKRTFYNLTIKKSLFYFANIFTKVFALLLFNFLEIKPWALRFARISLLISKSSLTTPCLQRFIWTQKQVVFFPLTLFTLLWRWDRCQVEPNNHRNAEMKHTEMKKKECYLKKRTWPWSKTVKGFMGTRSPCWDLIGNISSCLESQREHNEPQITAWTGNHIHSYFCKKLHQHEKETLSLTHTNTTDKSINADVTGSTGKGIQKCCLSKSINAKYAFTSPAKSWKFDFC